MNDDPDDSRFLNLEVTIRDPRWRQVVPDAETLVAQAARATLSMAHCGLGRHSCAIEASLTLADDALLRDLNHRYRGQDKPTNVLSFPADDDAAWPRSDNREENAPPTLLGDVVIGRQTALREAEDQDKAVRDHLCHLVVHGMLHLLGYDHEKDPEAEEMERLEVEILSTLGVGDPYLGEARSAERMKLSEQAS